MDQAGSGVNNASGMDLHLGKLRGLDDCWLGEEEDHEKGEGPWLTPRFLLGHL